MFWLVPPSFYTTHKSITAATAHNPIATGGTHRRCSFVLCGELTAGAAAIFNQTQFI